MPLSLDRNTVMDDIREVITLDKVKLGDIVSIKAIFRTFKEEPFDERQVQLNQERLPETLQYSLKLKDGREIVYPI